MKLNQMNHSIRVSLVIALFSVLLSVGFMPAIAAAEEQEGMWVLNDIKYGRLPNVDAEYYKKTLTLTATSASCELIPKGNPEDWSSSASWEAPPKTLQPGGKVHVSGHIVRNSYSASGYSDRLDIGFFGPGCYGWGTVCPPYYSDDDYSKKGEVRATIAEVTLAGDISVPSKDTEVSLAYQTNSGRVSYVYNYQEQPSETVSNVPEENQPQTAYEKQPLNVKLVVPENPTDVDVIEIEAEVSGDYKSPISYVWYKDNVKLEGETGYKIRFEIGVLPGEYRISVQVTDDEGTTGEAWTTLNVVEGDTGIRGDVLDVDSFESIPDAIVSATSLLSGVTKTVSVDSDGKYSVHLLPGHYQVSASAPSYLTESGTFGDDVKVLSPHDEPYCIDCYTTFNFRLVEEGCLLRTHNMAFKPWGAFNAKCDYFVGYVEETSEGISYLWENSINKDLQANGQATTTLIDNKIEQTITSNTPLDLKEGYQLAIKAIDLVGVKVYLELSKNGQVVDSKVRAPSKDGATMADKTYYYKPDVGKTKGIIQIAVHFKNAFRDSDTNIATIDGVFQISDSPKDILALKDENANVRVDAANALGAGSTSTLGTTADKIARFNKGNDLYNQGRYDEAIKAYDEAIKLDPNYANAWTSKGAALSNQGKYDEAIQAHNEAIKLDPNLAVAWYNKGIAHQALGRTSEADAAYAKAKELGYTG